MSIYDSSSATLRYGATLRDLQSPGFMAHPQSGTFQLLHVNLFEGNEGPTRAREHRHDVYHLVIFEEADNRMMLNQHPVDTQRGLCVLTPPDETHCFLPKRAGRTVYHAVTFRFADMSEPPGLQELLTHYTGIELSATPSCFVLPETAMVRLPGLLAALRSALRSRATSDAGRIYLAILGLLRFVGEQLYRHLDVEAPVHPLPAKAARDYLDTHYAEGVSMAALARHVSVTPAHLSRAFQNRYGISPGRYRDQLRMEAAVNLLRHSDLLVKTIAYELGYPDTSTFSKAFHRHNGMSPLRCRQS